MNDFSQLIPSEVRPWLLAAFVVVFLAVGTAMRKIVANIAPSPIRLEHPWGAAGADALVRQWTAAEVRAIRINLALDFVLIVSYAGGLVAGAALTSHVLGAPVWLAGTMAWASVTAGGFDVMENVGEYAMLADARGGWPLATSLCSSLKFALSGIALLYVICGLVAWIFHLKPLHP